MELEAQKLDIKRVEVGQKGEALALEKEDSSARRRSCS